MDKTTLILSVLDEMFPNAKAELNYTNHYELLVAVILSAQTTDIQVNKVTPILFKRYPTVYELSSAKQEAVEVLINSIGLYKNKAKNIIKMANQVVTHFDGIIPSKREDLESLAGVGRKTANVILSNLFDTPAIAVDTHVHRVSIRLGLAKKTDDVYQTEMKLYKIFPKERWTKLHHQLIFFGRYHCTSRNPKCLTCKLYEVCKYDNKPKKV